MLANLFAMAKQGRLEVCNCKLPRPHFQIALSRRFLPYFYRINGTYSVLRAESGPLPVKDIFMICLATPFVAHDVIPQASPMQFVKALLLTAGVALVLLQARAHAISVTVVVSAADLAHPHVQLAGREVRRYLYAVFHELPRLAVLSSDQALDTISGEVVFVATATNPALLRCAGQDCIRNCWSRIC